MSTYLAFFSGILVQATNNLRIARMIEVDGLFLFIDITFFLTASIKKIKLKEKKKPRLERIIPLRRSLFGLMSGIRNKLQHGGNMFIHHSYPSGILYCVKGSI
jgi:hypothetical protein